MAKKTARDNERRARAEQLRREQQRKERRRSVLILGACVVLVVGLLAAALIPYIKQRRDDARIANTPLQSLGSSTAAASCTPVTKKKATGNQQHLPVGTKIDYPDAPPAFGKHWGNFLVGSEIRSMYTTKDRPPLERLVHSLEHGHTILWYDDTVKKGTSSYQAIQQMADKLDAQTYFISAPWEKSDGASFPAGKHVALTHWTGGQNEMGATQYCASPSGAVVKKFMADYPKTDAPEPGAA